jgi:hypothetical protein
MHLVQQIAPTRKPKARPDGLASREVVKRLIDLAKPSLGEKRSSIRR